MFNNYMIFVNYVEEGDILSWELISKWEIFVEYEDI